MEPESQLDLLRMFSLCLDLGKSFEALNEVLDRVVLPMRFRITSGHVEKQHFIRHGGAQPDPQFPPMLKTGHSLGG
jgi:hypothetical protein